MEAAAATAAAPPAGGAPPRLAGAGEVQPSACITVAGHGRLGGVSVGRMLYEGAAINLYCQGGFDAVSSPLSSLGNKWSWAFKACDCVPCEFVSRY